MSALRLARAATGRSVIVKFTGCYHGHADPLLVAAGSGVATLGLPDSPGVTRGATADTVGLPYNDLPTVESLFAERGNDIAAVIVEPIAGNMGLVLPTAGFLEGLRRLTAAHGALLVFDEVMTGFRVAHGGAQELFDVIPDLTCLGKVMGGGLPAAAYGGREDLMRLVAPEGSVYQAGTLSGNPLAMAAGIATLGRLAEPGAYEQLTGAARSAAAAMKAAAERAGIALQVAAIGGMWGFFFAESPVTDYASAKRADTELYARFFHACLEAGLYIAPSQFEAAFVSLAHDADVLRRTSEAFTRAFEKVR